MSDRDEAGRFQPGHNVPGPGRPSLYDPEMNDQARKLALLGLTDSEIAVFFGVDVRTLNNWKDDYPAFFQSLNDGKVKADADVADSLFRRAMGEVVFVERRVKTKDGDYEIVRLSQSVPADPGAAKLWLTNRQPKLWREKVVTEHTGPDGGPVQIDVGSISDAALREIMAATRATPEPDEG